MPISVSAYNKKTSSDVPPDPSPPVPVEVDPILYRFSGTIPVLDIYDNIVSTVYTDSRTMKRTRFDFSRSMQKLR